MRTTREGDMGTGEMGSSSIAGQRRWFRLALGVALVAVAAAALAALAFSERGVNDGATTRGVTSILHLPSHPGWVSAAADTLWIAVNPSARPPVGRGSLVRVNSCGVVERTIPMGGEVFHTARAEGRLIASLQPTGDDGFGPGRLLALDWRSGRVLARRDLPGPGGSLAVGGGALWLLQVRPATLRRLDPKTLADAAAPLRLSSGRAFGLAFGAGHVWATLADSNKLIRIDPAIQTTTRVPVGAFPVGVTVARGSVWLVDHDDGEVVRRNPRTLRLVGEPIEVGRNPAYLAATAQSLFVANQGDGTVARIDLETGEMVGAPIRVAPAAEDAAAAFAVARAGRGVWVSSFTSNTVTRIEVRP